MTASAVQTALDLTPLAKLRNIQRELNEFFLERRWEIDLTLVGIISKRHVALIGGAGQGKTSVTRSIFSRIENSNLFHVQMNSFTQPEELHGPMNLTAFRDRGVLEFNTAGYLPWAHFGYLDEAFKGSSAVLNVMLTLLEERLFKWTDTDNIVRMMPVPLISAILTSNEMPQRESLAFQDRIMAWRLVAPLSRAGMTNLRLRDREWRRDPEKRVNPFKGTTISLGELAQIQSLVHTVTIPGSVMDAWEDILTDLQQEELLNLSPRRDLQAQDLLRAYVVLQGRMEAMASDLLVMTHALWHDPDIKVLRKIDLIVMKHCHELLGQCQEAYDALVDEVQATLTAISSLTNQPAQRASQLLNGSTKVKAALQKIESLIKRAQREGHDISEMNRILADGKLQHESILKAQRAHTW